MKFWLSLAVGVPVAVALFSHFALIYPFSRLAYLCKHERNYNATAGVSDTIDCAFCFLVNVFAHAMHDEVGYELTWILLALFGSVLAIMSVEGSRQGTNRIMSCVSLWGLLANLIGISVTQPLLWIPAYYYCYGDSFGSVQSRVSAGRLNAVLISLLVCYILPTTLMLLGPAPYSTLESNVIALWQLAPLPLSPMVHYLHAAFFNRRADALDQHGIACNNDSTSPTDGSRKALRRLYLTIAVFNATVYYIACTQLISKGLFSWDTLFDVVTLQQDKLDLRSLPLEQLGRIGATHVFFLDAIVTYGACCFWAALEAKWKGAVVLLLSSVVVGPGAGICFYAIYREEHLQVRRNPAKDDQ